MLKRVPRKDLIIDKMHRGAVLACVGLTFVGLFICGERAVNYLTRVKPEKIAAREELLVEDTGPRISD